MKILDNISYIFPFIPTFVERNVPKTFSVRIKLSDISVYQPQTHHCRCNFHIFGKLFWIASSVQQLLPSSLASYCLLKAVHQEAGLMIYGFKLCSNAFSPSWVFPPSVLSNLSTSLHLRIPNKSIGVHRILKGCAATLQKPQVHCRRM